MEVFWSLRMNDGHDSYPMGYRHQHDHDLALFKREHPEYLMGEPEDWEKYSDGLRRSWSHLDFKYPEVREHIFALIQEVSQNYDVDGIEMDFFRTPLYFTPTLDGVPVEEQHVEMMTDFMRRVQLPDIDILTTKVSKKGDCTGHNKKYLLLLWAERMAPPSTVQGRKPTRRP